MPSTFATLGAASFVFTWATTTFDTPLAVQGGMPVVTLAGADDEKADMPDASYWSRGDGSADMVNNDVRSMSTACI